MADRRMMKTLRHLAGICIGSIGLMFFFGFLFELIDGETNVAWWQTALFLIALGCFPLLCAAVLLRKGLWEVRPRRCPACGSDQCAPAGLLVKNTSWWAMHFGGWLLASLWGASREKQVRCVPCDNLYFTETRGTRIAGAVLWMVLLWILIDLALDSMQTLETQSL